MKIKSTYYGHIKYIIGCRHQERAMRVTLAYILLGASTKLSMQL